MRCVLFLLPLQIFLFALNGQLLKLSSHTHSLSTNCRRYCSCFFVCLFILLLFSFFSLSPCFTSSVIRTCVCVCLVFFVILTPFSLFSHTTQSATMPPSLAEFPMIMAKDVLPPVTSFPKSEEELVSYVLVCVCVCVCLSLSLSLSLSLYDMHTHTHTHTHSLSLSLSLSHIHTLCVCVECRNTAGAIYFALSLFHTLSILCACV